MTPNPTPRPHQPARSHYTRSRRMVSEEISNGHRDPSSDLLLKNDSKRRWVVQKYGGTSVGKFATNIAEDIIR